MDKKNQTALYYAAKNNSVDIAELLISKGADINARDRIYLNIYIYFWIMKILKELR